MILGTLWGLALAAVPVLLMTEPYRLTGFLVVTLVCAALSGCVGTLAAGRRAARKIGREGTDRSAVLAGVGTGAIQGLVGGAIAALLFWTLMALSISGFTLRDPVELSALMEPGVFMGSFFVALSAFLYTLAGGLLLGPVFGMVVNRVVRGSKKGTGGKEDLDVR